MFENERQIWCCGARKIDCAAQTQVMGILNMTPDSFSDGGRFASVQQGVESALQMWADGAQIIDVGGESTRPGAAPVSADEEIARTIPVIEALRRRGDGLISIDTMKAEVARAAVAAGAEIINDVSACSDPEMAAVAAESGAGLVLMHMQGVPESMQRDPHYADAVGEVISLLKARAAEVAAQGVRPQQICLDPGIGFGKADEHNLALLRALPQLAALGYPVLIGVSRKSLFGRLLGRPVGERLAASLAVGVFSMLRGASILRVHDVKESCDAVRLVDRLRTQGLCE